MKPSRCIVFKTRHFTDIKEHVAITIMASTASDASIAISIFATQDLYYNVRPNVAIAIFT
jgi:hypothetical protein